MSAKAFWREKKNQLSKTILLLFPNAKFSLSDCYLPVMQCCLDRIKVNYMYVADIHTWLFPFETYPSTNLKLQQMCSQTSNFFDNQDSNLYASWLSFRHWEHLSTWRKDLTAHQALKPSILVFHTVFLLFCRKVWALFWSTNFQVKCSPCLKRCFFILLKLHLFCIFSACN